MRIENSFIPVRGVGELTEQRLWERGVTHWEDFEPGAVGEKTAARIENFIGAAWESLDDGDSRFFSERFPSGSLWRIYENFRSETTFFDIETTGLDQYRNVVTTVSFHRDGETTTLVRGRDLTREALRRELDASSVLVSFNGKRFDQPFLEHEFDLDVDLPHVDLLYPCKRLGLTGGLKRIERDLGIDRGGVEVDGLEAVRLWHRYEAGDQDALDRLVEYNRYDTQNLETLFDHVHDRMTEQVFRPHLPTR